MTETAKQLPRLLTDDYIRKYARKIRDNQWSFMERCAAANPLWFCIWNKRDLPEQPDELRCSLLTGMEIESWIGKHMDWFDYGTWDEGRYARPVSLTEAGRQALTQRHLYDNEPVEGGMVEPGWIAYPTPATAPTPIPGG